MCIDAAWSAGVRSAWAGVAHHVTNAAPAFGAGGPTQEDFAAMLRGYAGEVSEITERLARGEINPVQWSIALDELMLGAHTESWRMGRQLAGDLSDNEFIDRIMGIAAKDKDADYLLRFVDQLQAGDARYFDEDGAMIAARVTRRAHMYIQRARGTANEALLMRSPDLARWTWNLGGSEENCPDCPELAVLLVDVPRLELITTPGACGTPCLTECNCFLTSDAGVRGFSKVDF